MTRQYPIAIASAFALLLIGTLSAPAGAQTTPNILMIIVDDVGVDMIGAYQPYEGSDPDYVPPTPSIDSLADQGVQFLNTWSNPLCATTRATIQTGRYSYRTRVGGGSGELPDEEFSIAEILIRDAALDYPTATFGKWGLAKPDDGMHAVQTGYDFFAGEPWCCISDYFDWDKYTTYFTGAPDCDRSDPEWHLNPNCIGVGPPAEQPEQVLNYATTENVDDTIDWIGSLPPEQPWFAILSFNAAHSPFHVPPEDDPDCPYSESLDCTNDSQSCYRAMIEVMDCHIGRLLNGLPDDDKLASGNTTIIFVGDNGSPDGMAREPFRTDRWRAKGTTYEGGINVPLIIAGAGVSGTARVSQALVNTTDLFTTVLELAGVDPGALPTHLPDTGEQYHGQAWEHDSFSLMPILTNSAANIREYAYASKSNVHHAIRNRAGYKLLNRWFTWEFYNLNTDPFEYTNLIAPLVDPDTGAETPLVHPRTGKLLQRGLLDAEAEAAYFDLSQKLELLGGLQLPAANLDSDADAVADDEDNCVALVNQDQRDTNQDGYGNVCDADFDNDGDCDDDDWDRFIDAYGRQGVYDPDMDCDGDGRINLSDFACFKRATALECPGPSGLDCAGSIPCIADEDDDGVRNLDDNCSAFANPDQRDTNEEGYGNVCDADYDNDGDVDDDDLAAFQAAYGRQGEYDEDIDCDGDGIINLSDFACFKRGEALGYPGPSGLICAGTVPCVSPGG